MIKTTIVKNKEIQESTLKLYIMADHNIENIDKNLESRHFSEEL